MRSLRSYRLVASCALGVIALSAAPDRLRAQEAAPARAPVDIQPFFDAHCVRCHGERRQKGDVSLHQLAGGPRTGHQLELWERVLEVLERGEMPPRDEDQPDEDERERVAAWIAKGLDAAPIEDATAPATTRRLTNREYHNTMRDLLGVELALTDNLPEDPKLPYRANNTPAFLLMGLEQLDRYAENARRAMASVLVDPTPPEPQRTRKSLSLIHI